MTPTGVLLVTPIFRRGSGSLSLLRGPSRVALALHKARCGTPLGVTNARVRRRTVHWADASGQPKSTCCGKRNRRNDSRSEFFAARSEFFGNGSEFFGTRLEFFWNMQHAGLEASAPWWKVGRGLRRRAPAQVRRPQPLRPRRRGQYHSVHFITNQSFAFY